CEGEVTRIGRVWADGQLVNLSDVTWRLYPGSETQLPDALVAANLPEGEAPAFRGTAYVVIEDLDLTPYGNRIPQFSFEVMRNAGAGSDVEVANPGALIQGVALVPGTGEYSLATEQILFNDGKGVTRTANVNNDFDVPDIERALEQLDLELPACQSVVFVVSWFGDDLRVDRCTLRPRAEQTEQDAETMAWMVSGETRASARQVSYVDDRPGFGGTPADAAAVQAIRKLNESGKKVVFYPFILMDIREGNGLENPWTGAGEQPPVPWRGRITLSRAPGVSGSPDQSSAAAAEVAAFFGTAAPGDFTVGDGTVSYSGPAEWSYRRFILHYAALCAAAGGVDAFCIGSEMRSLTQIRSAVDAFPAVEALRTLAADCRAILGPDVKIGYAADWSEYFGYQPGSGDVFYHLDPLWADGEIDFVGIDNYMPLSDWRDGTEHLDAGAGSIYDLDYLTGNVAGGEGYDWFYASSAARDAQLRTPIEDGAYGEPWVFRYKDLRNWWSRPHRNRIGGVRAAVDTPWQAEMKPIWFTEFGCPAVDKGTNQPNVFIDPQSSESFVPYYSNGSQDDFIQTRYLQAVLGYWGQAENNPVSRVYGEPMIDLGRAHVWAWDARPWPDFPNRLDVWADGRNYGRGHWISGRTSLVALADLATEVAARVGVTDVNVSGLHGAVRGFVIAGTETARQSLQPLMLAGGFDAFEERGSLVFRTRGAEGVRDLDPAQMVVEEAEGPVELTRLPLAETPHRVRASFVAHNKNYEQSAAEARYPGVGELTTSVSDMPIAMEADEAGQITERWLAEAHVGRDQARFVLPRSMQAVGLGDVVRIEAGRREMLFRIDRIEEGLGRSVDATRIERDLYVPRVRQVELVAPRGTTQPSRLYVEIMDLPLLDGSEVAHAPHIAATASPWPGPVSVWMAPADYGYAYQGEIPGPSPMGELTVPLVRAAPDLWAGQEAVVQLSSGALESRSREDVLNGANAAALRTDGDWEVIQYETAELIGPLTYRLSGLLRGQAGTDGIIPDAWPVGTDFVALNGRAVQPDLPLSARGLERHYRVGPASLAYDAPEYIHLVETVEGVGLRPYAPAQLRAVEEGGDIRLTWIRRTRIDGDVWSAGEVPLGESFERYHVRILRGGALLREREVAASEDVYTAAEQAADAPGPWTVEVAQISERFGPGLYSRIDINA
ncbi:MAG: glycoside hydrolase/phage tail family protein, partial [Pseudomonadota bacterium]